MARPTETGLSYFPLDVDFDYDDKFQMILAKHKAEGCWIVLIVLCKVYDEGYYYNWTEREQLLTSRRVNSELTTVIECINTAIHFGIFDQEKYDKYGILTSNGIQKRYFEATKKRKQLTVISDFIVNGNINLVNSNINLVIPEKSVHSKVKESKVKESKVNNIIPELYEFISYCKTLSIYDPSLDFQIEAKYNSWAENKWKDGHNNPIKNWKTKIQNVMPYFKRGNNGTGQSGKRRKDYVTEDEYTTGLKKLFEG